MTGFHHVAFACQDIEATTRFYDDLLGFPLVYTEVQGDPEHFMRHIFFDLGDGSSLAFFRRRFLRLGGRMLFIFGFSFRIQDWPLHLGILLPNYELGRRVRDNACLSFL